ncbi:MAG: ADP-ribosylglycohydrolase family protein [Sphingomonadaceae bacterium]
MRLPLSSRLPYHMDRVEGMIVGGAVGDALGAPIEFLNIARIRELYGPTGISDMAQTYSYGTVGSITDDTQMTLFTLEGILFAGEPAEVLPEIRDAYKRWYKGQMGEPYKGASTLMDEPAFTSRRVPGTTCLSALAAGGWGRTSKPINDSAGCGGVMRVAPCAVLGPWGHDVFAIAAEAAAITHGHPRGYLPAGFLALLLSRILERDTLLQAINTACEELERWPNHEETLGKVERAIRFWKQPGAPTPSKVEELGGGWVGDEALAIALYAALTAQSFRDGVLVAVNHSGDSDSTGSIAGQILGAYHGLYAIPDTWRNKVEAIETIGDLAFQLWLKGWEAGKWQ